MKSSFSHHGKTSLAHKGMLNVDSMNEAARNFIGYHDFTAFCSSGHNITSFERNIYISQWTVDNEHLVYTVSGDGFYITWFE